MKKRKVTRHYTVILMYPDYLTNDYPLETYMTTVRAADPGEAQMRAQEEAWAPHRDAYGDGPDKAVDLDDFYVIATIRGKHADIKE